MKISKLRQQIAREAARFIYQHPDLRFSDARQLAVERCRFEGLNPRDMPSDEEVTLQLKELSKADKKKSWSHRFSLYLELLKPLAEVEMHPEYHPEGDALYHSLQVFQLARNYLPYDEEVQTAALLHEVGRAVDRFDAVNFSLSMLEGIITDRMATLIENIPVAVSLRNGKLGLRAQRRFKNLIDFEELLILGRCDVEGRQVGVDVPDVEDALGHLEDMNETFGE